MEQLPLLRPMRADDVRPHDPRSRAAPTRPTLARSPLTVAYHARDVTCVESPALKHPSVRTSLYWLKRGSAAPPALHGGAPRSGLRPPRTPPFHAPAGQADDPLVSRDATRTACPQRAQYPGNDRASPDNSGHVSTALTCEDAAHDGLNPSSKLAMRVRFPSPAPPHHRRSACVWLAETFVRVDLLSSGEPRMGKQAPASSASVPWPIPCIKSGPLASPAVARLPSQEPSKFSRTISSAPPSEY